MNCNVMETVRAAKRNANVRTQLRDAIRIQVIIGVSITRQPDSIELCITHERVVPRFCARENCP